MQGYIQSISTIRIKKKLSNHVCVIIHEKSGWRQWLFPHFFYGSETWVKKNKKGSNIQAPENLTFMSVRITRLIKSCKL